MPETFIVSIKRVEPPDPTHDRNYGASVDVYEQRVEGLDIAAVIRAVNGFPAAEAARGLPPGAGVHT